MVPSNEHTRRLSQSQSSVPVSPQTQAPGTHGDKCGPLGAQGKGATEARAPRRSLFLGVSRLIGQSGVRGQWCAGLLENDASGITDASEVFGGSEDSWSRHKRWSL